MTLREFIKEAAELCSGNLDTQILIDDTKMGYCGIMLDHDGEDLIVMVSQDEEDEGEE